MQLRKLWKNEYFKLLVFVLIILAFLASFWFGLKAVLKTDHPFLTVSSGSMCRRGLETGLATTNCDGLTCIFYPTLHIGDLIIIEGVDASEIKAAPYPEGDIIVFHNPNNPKILVVHRAIAKKYKDGRWFFVTQGDGLTRPDHWGRKLTEEDIVGRVIFRIPLLGHIPLFFHTPTGNVVFTLIVILLAILLISDALSSAMRRREEEPLGKAEKEI